MYRQPTQIRSTWRPLLFLAGLVIAAPAAHAQQLPPNTLFSPNPSGSSAAFSGANESGQIDFNNPFFQPIGRQFGGNSRSCSTCHIPANGWSITPQTAQSVFDATDGLDPLFDPVDGTNAPNMSRTTTEQRRLASSMLLNKGLIKINVPVRSTFDYTLLAARAPTDGTFPSDFAQNAVRNQVMSVYRRPPATANISFLTDVMWDARETEEGLTLFEELFDQTIAAARGHFRAGVPNNLTATQRQMFESIINFELNLFSAQIQDNVAGRLNALNAIGGPLALFAPPPQFFQGGVFNFYTPWNQLTGTSAQVQMQRSIARGEALFNTRVFTTGLVGRASCSTCHGVRGTGNSMTQRRFNLGLSNPNIAIGGVRVNSAFPVYTLRNKSTGALIFTTDPGRIGVSGLWGSGQGDAFKVPILRNLAGRAPYFHGGQAATLNNVVQFYNGRFKIGLTNAQITDLVNFLRTL